MNTITCIGRDGIARTFNYTHDEEMHDGRPKWNYQIRVEGQRMEDEFFELSLREIQPGVLQVAVLRNQGAAHLKAMGILDTLIPHLKTELLCQIESSPKNGGPGIFRTPDATRVWNRLVAKGLATYDASRDVYGLV